MNQRSVSWIQRRLKASRGEPKHLLNLLPGHVVLLDDFFDTVTYLQVFKNPSDELRVPLNTHAPLRRSATLSPPDTSTNQEST